MKILITGGCGFIGSHLACELIKTNKVYIVDNLSTGSLDNIKSIRNSKNLFLYIDSIMNKDLLDEIISQVDLIYHLAAAVGVRLIIENPVDTIETNVMGTEIILRVANKYKKKLFLASSSEVYGKHDHSNLPLKEDDDRILGPTLKFRWSYSCSKAIDEFLAFAYFKEKKLPVVIGRLFNIVGERQTGRYGMVLPTFVKQALLNQPITVFGDGNQTRTFLYVKDAIKAMISLMEEDKAIGDVFNIGSCDEIKIKDLAYKVKEQAKSKSPIVYIPYEKAYEKDFEDMQRRVPDISKLQNLINFKPTLNLSQIIDKVIEYHKA
jgi:UDP-glucose 4-epimerase